jgi:hypothetical protein
MAEYKLIMKMKKILMKIAPQLLKLYWEVYKFPKKKRRMIKNVIHYLENYPYNELDEEKKSIYTFLKCHSYYNIGLFPYLFIENYKSKNIKAYYDLERKMYYVLHKSKRLYFPHKWKKRDVQKIYNNLIKEQDSKSPHCYETSDFYVNVGDVVADIGTAEGNFALDVVDRVKKMYLFEPNPIWIEALDATFSPYKDKVIIVNKYVSDNNNENCISLDQFFCDEKIDFIKADIEGAEPSMLLGAKNILSSGRYMKMVLCTYHHYSDADVLQKILIENGFSTVFSNGYMIFFYDKDTNPPYLRHGLIRAVR